MTAMVAGATLAACSGGDDGGTDPTPEINIALSAAALSIVQGATGTSTVTLTRAGGFTGDVAVTVEGLPAGVTAVAAPATLNAATTSSVITLTVAGTAGVATTPLTVRATGTGVTAKTAPLALTVTAAPASGFTLAATTPVALPQGSTGTSTVTITRTGGFAGAVTLTATGLPTGVTAAFNPAAPTTNTSTLTLTASATATVGAATVTVRGNSGTLAEQTAVITVNVTAATAGAYTIAVTPATVPIVQGATATANVALTRTGGFAGAVTFTVEGLPTGVTGAFAPNNTTTNASVLTLTAAANATVGGPTTVTVKGTAAGQTDKTATFALNVTAAPVGGFTLAATTPVAVQQGGTGTSTVTITRTNAFAGAVTLTATGLPNGVTAAFNPAAPTTNTSTLTLTASATATIGAATVTIRGNSGTLAEQTAVITVNVTAATGGSGNTAFEFCTASQTPLWLAVQDGATGTWARVNPTGTKFQFNITQAKAGVAFVTGTTSGSVASATRSFAARLGAELQRELLLRNRPTRVNAYAARSLVDGFALNVLYGTQAELNGQGTTRCLPGAGKTVNGSVAGVGSQQSASISLGPSAASVAGGGATTFQLKDVPDGALDLVASRTTTTISGTSFSIAVDKLIIRRGINAANNSTLPVLDFGAAEAFDPAQANITLGNLGSEVGFALTSYFTAAGSGASGASLAGFSLPGSGPFKYYGVPTARQIAGDLHVAIGFAVPNLMTTDQSRFAALYFKDPTDRTVTLGAALTAPTVSTAATAPYVRFRATGPIQATYNKVVAASFTQGGSAPRQVTIQASEGYLAGSANYDYTIPDFTAVAGWDNNWGPKTGAQTTWSVTAYGFTGVGFGTSNPLEGSTFAGASRTGTITP